MTGLPAEYAKNLPPNVSATPKPVVRELDEHRYARQTRNATVFMAVIVGIGVAFTVIVGIVAAIALTSLTASVNGGGNGGGGSIYNCQSLGGTDPSC